MSALLIGVLVVVVCSAAFALALFGRRPIPQIATHPGGSSFGGPGTVTVPSGTGGAMVAAHEDVPPGPALVRTPWWVRLRSGVLLILAVVAMAALAGAVLGLAAVALGSFVG